MSDSKKLKKLKEIRRKDLEKNQKIEELLKKYWKDANDKYYEYLKS